MLYLIIYVFYFITDEYNQLELKKKESSSVYQSGPSTSKSPSLIVKTDNFSNIKSDDDKQTTNSSIYFMTKTDKIRKDDVFYNSSPSIPSEHSNSSFSENSVDFSSDECLSNDVTKYNNTLGLNTFF